MKLALGTVQFGLDYGINNKIGKVSEDEVFKILEHAHKQDITILDTAYNYGESEKVIGKYLKNFPNTFNVISKFPNSSVCKIEDVFEESLSRLNIKRMYGYMFHDFKTFLNDPQIYDIFNKLKAKGKIEKIGFSLYYPEDLKYLFDNKIEFDIVQVPYSVFDQRFENYFKELKKRNVEIYARSVFLQGLVFKNTESLDDKFNSIKPKIEKLQVLSKKTNISISALCLNFAALNNDIDNVVIGIDSLKNLEDNISDLKFIDKIKNIYNELKNLKEDDEFILLPFNWGKK
jgi:aryl-alcohol dehydrogenase-like predicted oxidoreductase